MRLEICRVMSFLPHSCPSTCRVAWLQALPLIRQHTRRFIFQRHLLPSCSVLIKNFMKLVDNAALNMSCLTSFGAPLPRHNRLQIQSQTLKNLYWFFFTALSCNLKSTIGRKPLRSSLLCMQTGLGTVIQHGSVISP